MQCKTRAYSKCNDGGSGVAEGVDVGQLIPGARWYGIPCTV